MSNEELAETERLEAIKRERFKTVFMYASGAFILLAPWLLHFSKILCAIYHVAPPDDTVIMGACLTAIVTTATRALMVKKQ